MDALAGKEAAAAFDYPTLSSEEGIDEDICLRLGFAIHDSARLRKNLLDELFRPLQLTRAQSWVMACLRERDGMPQTDLAAQTCLGMVSLSGIITRLQDIDMVQRQSDPLDRRVKRIFITSKGRRTMQAVNELLQGMDEAIFADLSEAELRSAVAVLSALNGQLASLRSDLRG